MQQAAPPPDSIVESNTLVAPSFEEVVKAAPPPDSAVESNTTEGREYISFCWRIPLAF